MSEQPETGQVISLRSRTRQDELERLNRVTGLKFEGLPPSLLDLPPDEWEAFAEILLGQAMSIWSDPEVAP